MGTWGRQWVLVACAALVMTGHGLVAPALAPAISGSDGAEVVLSLMFAVFAGGQLIGAPALGKLADRVGRAQVVHMGLAAIAVTNLLYVLLDDPRSWVGVRGLHGLLSAGVMPAAMAMAVRGEQGAARERTISAFAAAAGAGFAFGPLVGGALAAPFGTRAPFFATMVLACVGLVMTRNLRETHDALRSEAPERAKPRLSPWRLAAAAGATALGMTLLAQGAIAWLEPILTLRLHEELGMGPGLIGLTFSAYGGAVLFGQPVSAWALRRFGARSSAAVGFVLQAAAISMLGWVTQLWGALGLAVMLGAGAALVLPAISVLALEGVDDRDASAVLGVKESASALGLTLGPLAATTGLAPSWVFVWTAGLMGAGAVVSIVRSTVAAHAG